MVLRHLRLMVQREFIMFLGDEIVRPTAKPEEFRHQWRYWTDVEMKWQKKRGISLYRTTSNHTVCDDMIEAICHEVQPHIAWNGPSGRPALSNAIHSGNMRLVFVNRVCSALGVEGDVDTDWNAEVLHDHRDVTTKLIAAHRPIYAVNGYSALTKHIEDPDRRCRRILRSRSSRRPS